MEMRFVFFLAIMFLAMYNLKANILDNELKNLSYEQRELLFKVYEDGKKFDLQWTLTAIAWQESSFGKHLVNPNSQDYGIFQINLKTYKNRFGEDMYKAGISEKAIVKLLTEHYKAGMIAAVHEIYYWKKVRGENNWNMIWASYNDGTIIGDHGRLYSKRIAQKIQALKRFIKNEKI